MNIRGKVKSVKETEFVAIDKDGQVEKGEERWFTYYLFDENGNKIEESEYWGGEIREKTLFFYNEHTLLKQKRKVYGRPSVFYPPKEPRELNEVLNYLYYFDSNGKLNYRLIVPGSAETAQMHFLGDSTVYLYNGGRLVEERGYQRTHHYSGDGEEASVRDVSVWKYNELGKVQIWIMNGTEVYEDLSKPINQRVAGIRFNKAILGNLIRYDTAEGTRYYYDKNLLPTKTIHFSTNFELKRTINSYEVLTEYNESGDPVTEETIKIGRADVTSSDHDSQRIISYTYKYDSHKNWVTKIMYINGIVKDFREREYEYF